jgi:hypothetical protein
MTGVASNPYDVTAWTDSRGNHATANDNPSPATDVTNGAGGAAVGADVSNGTHADGVAGPAARAAPADTPVARPRALVPTRPRRTLLMWRFESIVGGPRQSSK